jgi:hypothetical protein
VIDTGPLFDAPDARGRWTTTELSCSSSANPGGDVAEERPHRARDDRPARLPRERVSLVANRIGAAGAVARDDIEDALDTKIAFELPDDPEVPAASTARCRSSSRTRAPASRRPPAACRHGLPRARGAGDAAARRFG